MELKVRARQLRDRAESLSTRLLNLSQLAARVGDGEFAASQAVPSLGLVQGAGSEVDILCAMVRQVFACLVEANGPMAG
jgi:hypothetical protein